MYDVYLRLNRKRVVDFLLVLTELYLQGVTAEALQANIDGKLPFLLERGQSCAKFQVQGVVPTNHSSVGKLA